jgi:heme/copper-type cytochrome/quinol oxidase subunit 2
MLSLILIYRDLLITITAVTIMAVLLIQYFVPLIRERKKQQADAPQRVEKE